MHVLQLIVVMLFVNIAYFLLKFSKKICIGNMM